MLKKLIIEVDKGQYTEYVFDSSKDFKFEDWPIEAQVEFLNIILILYNLHLIPERVFREKYQPLVEEYKEFMDVIDNYSGVRTKNAKIF